jgi:hypothetical protein
MGLVLIRPNRACCSGHARESLVRQYVRVALWRRAGGSEGFLPSSPNGEVDQFDGLNGKLFNPIDAQYFQGKSDKTLPIFPGANATDMPNPDPKEDYDNVNYQLFGSALRHRKRQLRSHLSFALPSLIVCHCMLNGASAPPHSWGLMSIT